MAIHILVAKYVSNLQRMEPKNIGLIGWCDGRMKTRFLEKPPAFLEPDAYAFSEWKDSWRYLTSRQELSDYRTGELIPVSDSRFLDVLISRSKPQFALTKSSVVHQPTKQFESVMDEMFALIVAKPKVEQSVSRMVTRDEFLSVIKNSTRLPNYQDCEKETTLNAEVFGVIKPLKFDFAYGVKQTAVFQRFVPGSGNSANLAALMLDSIRKDHDGINRCAVYRGEDLDQSARKDLRMISTVATPIDISNSENAANLIENAVGIA